MYNFALNHPQFSFVLIPDRRFKNLCNKKGIYTEEEFNQILNKWEQLPNASCVEYLSSIDLFKTSDLLITDSLAAAADYFPGVKPIVFIEKSDKPNLNPFGEKAYKTFYKATSNEAIELIIEDILVSENDYNAESRNLLLSKNHKVFDCDSTQSIIDYLKFELGRNSINS